MASMSDGLPTIINIGETGLVCEIELTPPAIEGGEGVPLDCMRSGRWGIMAPRQRRRLSAFTVLVSWNPQVYAENILLAPAVPLVVVNLNQIITITFPDGFILSFYGFITKFAPQPMKEGERPTANITIQPSLYNPQYCAAAAPTYTTSVRSPCAPYPFL